MSKKKATLVQKGPCHAEAEASRVCMEESNGVKSKCIDHFEAYKDCKTRVYERKQVERKETFFGKQ